MAVRTSQELRQRRHNRIRRSLAGTPERPRLAVFRSLRHISAQLIDDEAGQTLCSASTMEKDQRKAYGGNVGAARELAKLVAQRAKEKGVGSIVFDRGGFRYAGRVKAFADALREEGLRF